jgi:hypothetical protein
MTEFKKVGYEFSISGDFAILRCDHNRYRVVPRLLVPEFTSHSVPDSAGRCVACGYEDPPDAAEIRAEVQRELDEAEPRECVLRLV